MSSFLLSTQSFFQESFKNTWQELKLNHFSCILSNQSLFQAVLKNILVCLLNIYDCFTSFEVGNRGNVNRYWGRLPSDYVVEDVLCCDSLNQSFIMYTRTSENNRAPLWDCVFPLCDRRKMLGRNTKSHRSHWSCALFFRLLFEGATPFHLGTETGQHSQESKTKVFCKSREPQCTSLFVQQIWILSRITVRVKFF